MLIAPLVVAYPHAQAAQPRQEARAQAPQAASKPMIVPVVIVNLNTATVKDLEMLPGVGTKTAERIIEYRTKKGPFKKIEELMNVQGIGEKNFLKLKPQLTVAAKPEPNNP
jgi:competence protein ComEA